MQESTQQIYEKHHREDRPEDFSILEEERGALFKERIGAKKQVLDLGCRNGVLTKHFLKGNKVTGADIDTVALAKAQELGIDTIHIDLNGNWAELHGKESSFDVVVMAETLEHLYYPEQVIKKVKNYLKKDGMFIGSVPNAFNLKNRLRLLFGRKDLTPLQDPTHINHFKYSELKELLEQHFESVEIKPLGRFAFLDKLIPGMFSFILTFICTDQKEEAE